MDRSFFESMSVFERGEREEKLEVFSTLNTQHDRVLFDLERQALRLSLELSSKRRQE
jgi:hypothetical protein